MCCFILNSVLKIIKVCISCNWILSDTQRLVLNNPKGALDLLCNGKLF